MDTTDPEIVFDSKGVCNHCHNAQRELDLIRHSPPLPDLKNPKNKYDVLIGLSGGVDSSMVLHKAVEMGLRPLCFSVDNGWQTKKADENIMRMVEGLRVPYYRYTIDLKKFRELQNAFIKSHTANIEIPTDHILMATTLELASEYGITTILSGGNVATESIMPSSWGYNARDLRFIKSVYKKFTHKNLSGLPMCSWLKWNWYRWIKRIKTIYLLDYFHYNREDSIKLLRKKYGYQPYGEKHEESVFTKWFQNEYLPDHGIDKMRAHYSSLINSGQMNRPYALTLLKHRKLGNVPLKSYRGYPNSEAWWDFWTKVIRTLKWKF